MAATIGRRALLAGTGPLLLARSTGAQRQPPHIAIVEQGEPVESMVEGGHPYWDAFLVELRRLGHVEGATLAISRWSAGGEDDQGYARMAAAVVETRPDVIVARGTRAMLAFRAATSTIPVVATATFFESNLARPEGNVTGIDPMAGGLFVLKHLEFLRAAVPSASRIAWLGPRDFWNGQMGEVARGGADALGVELVPIFIDSPTSESTVRAAMARVVSERFPALYVSSSPDISPYTRTIAEAALAARLPAVAFNRNYADAGLLMAYAPDLPEVYRRAAHYVDQILAGADPAGMPIEQPTEFDLVVNLRTAAALGITLPPEIMILATEVIE